MTASRSAASNVASPFRGALSPGTVDVTTASSSDPGAPPATILSRRHSARPRAARRGGVNERVVMKILGHSTPAMTQRYSHVLAPMLTDAVDRLEALWARSAGG